MTAGIQGPVDLEQINHLSKMMSSDVDDYRHSEL